MKQGNVIEVKNATVRFNMASEKIDNLKEYVIKMLKRDLMFQEHLALKNINLEVKKGASLGLIGNNGAGKSTLLKMICKVLKPYKGSVETKGLISPMIELGAGFNGALTGRENIYLNAYILGHSKKLIDEYFDRIVDFADIHKYLDMPVKNYSSGMKARLGFAVSTVVKPDILIVDEVLSVGDRNFQSKCIDRMDELLKGGTTLLFVSHNMNTIKKMCGEVAWLEKGDMVMKGPAEEVVKEYIRVQDACRK